MKPIRFGLIQSLATLVTLVVLVGMATTAEGAITYAYWADNGNTTLSIRRTDAAGTATTNLYSTNGAGVALDDAGGMVYWTNYNGGAINRAAIAGGGSVTSPVSGRGSAAATGVWDLSLDLVNSKIYWTEFAARRIMSSNLDGTGVTTLLTLAGGNTPYGIEVDPVGGKVYWTVQGTNLIQRANLDGSSVQTIASGFSGRPAHLTIDPLAQVVYWANDTGGRLEKHNADGSGTTQTVLSGQTLPRGIAVDPYASQLYFTDPNVGVKTVFRVNTDGTGLITLRTLEAQSNPNGIDLILPEPTSLALLALGAGVTQTRRRMRG